MGLLDGLDIQGLFGTILDPIYGSGRLIRRTMVRQSNGTLIPDYQKPIPIKVQVDKLDSAMRTQQGYTQRAQKDYTDQDVKLLILQHNVGGPELTTDDIVEAKGRWWNIYDLTEDPASSYWSGRGVRIASRTSPGWILELNHWDDQGSWMTDGVKWIQGLTPEFSEIDEWADATTVQESVEGLILSAGLLANSWSSATVALNTMLTDADMIPISVGDSGLSVRTKINTLVAGDSP